MKIDLRSDTFTTPTPGMLERMFKTSVGDDVFGEDPTVNQLEHKMAAMFQKEAAVFCPSGTMTNQIAIKVHTQPQDQVICDQRSHVYNYEGGGMAFNSLVSAKLIDGDRGRINATQVSSSLNPDDQHFPVSKLVVVENTVNKGGGSYYQIEEVRRIQEVAKNNDLRMHLDGARLFNALAETGESTGEWGALFDTISICLSKGLGAPVGSVLIGSKKCITQARRVRKVLGGAMRQAGFLAAAGLYALDNHQELLVADNQRARVLGTILEAQSYVSKVHPVDTNILIFELDQLAPQHFLNKLSEHDVLALPFGGQEIRMVTHLGVDDAMLDRFEEVMKNMKL